MFPNYTLWYMHDLDLDITVMDPNRIRVEVSFKLGDHRESLGILYFEKAKVGFVRKPIGLNAWACVDANIEGLKVHLAEDDESAKNGVRISFKEITPKEIVRRCQDKIREAGL